MCKKLPNRQNGKGYSVVHTIQSIEKGISGMTGDAQGRHACMICQRKFTIDRIHTHENVCRRRFANKTITLADPNTSSGAHSVDPSQKPKTMTLSDLNRPKSKQMNKMPSLKNKPLPVKKTKEVKAFAGQGVRLGSLSDAKEESKKPATSFSGLTKVNKAQPKVDFKWRC